MPKGEDDMPANRFARLPGLLLALAFAAPAGAQDAQVVAANDRPSSGITAFTAQAVDATTLSGYRGGTQTVNNDITVTGTTSNNSAQDVSTGTNSIGTGAFSNMSGLPVVIQNSGANVLIQNAVILHVQMN